MPATLTPMMQQYMQIKEQYADCIVLYRLGDFYEMFFEDALLASRELEIVLTGRDCGLEERAPMCGVPYHAVELYISRLIEKGHKVAICEQVTDPKESQGLVEREVLRVITPGTIIEESMLSERQNNYIVSLYLLENNLGMAYCDVSTGALYVLELQGDTWIEELTDELARVQPTEIVANDALFLQQHLVTQLQSAYYTQSYGSWAFEPEGAKQRLLAHFKVNDLCGFGCEDMAYAVPAAGALMAYLTDTQKNALEHIRGIRAVSRCAYMRIDAASRRNLELIQPIRAESSKRNTLLNLLDQTATSMGGRLLRAWVEQPLQSQKGISARLDAVESLYTQPVERSALQAALSSVYDIERLCSRIAYGTVNARDCNALRRSLGCIPGIASTLCHLSAGELGRIRDALDPMEDIYALLQNAIIEEPPVSVKEGGMIRDGYNAELDGYRDAARNGKDWLARFEADERADTGIKNLKVGFNRVFGYYLEVTKTYQHLVPYTYQRKQTLANCERYITPALKDMETTILGAEDNAIALEYELFVQLRGTLNACIDRLQTNAQQLAMLDVYQSLAQAAFVNGYSRPKLNTAGKIEIVDGRHPVVERGMREGFIPNNTLMDSAENRLLILTGPNMAGKSTYMRQVALIVLMAHIGSFVPAASASIAITDRIFTRIGASDSLASGQSTFMVEMSEMSNILNNATAQSLLIIDEVGRGTSTFDGLSIAWAVLEHIADTAKCGAKTLFATHYHELTELEGKLNGIKNYRISVKEVGEDILFLRKIVRGGADKSFGVQVARLAGLPEGVIRRAMEILKKLEESDINHDAILEAAQPAPAEQLTLFGPAKPDDILNDLREIDIDALTPRDALNQLYDLHLRARMRET
ncbi:MAG: DNA mismatch repair protein MutS [Christensenellaceae bacterium]|jgi:DNA mismatch repair protein MutS|nr:DNA mismatch repair protein MutS [Christensenellaceae bacterium]